MRDYPAGVTDGAYQSFPRGWRSVAVVFLVLFAIYGLTSTRGVASGDDHAPAVEAWAIAATGSPWLEHVLDEHIDHNPWLHRVPNGHVVADRMAGPVLICVPFYWLFGSDPDTRTFSLVPAGIAAAFVTALTGALMFSALRGRLGTLLGGVVAAAFSLATPTWSVSADGPWTHTVTQLGLAGAALGASRRSWWLTGAFLGLGMWGRPHIAVIAAVLGLGMSWSTRSIRPAVRIGIAGTFSLVLLMLWNHWMFGVWSVASAGYAGHGHAALGGAPVNPDLEGWRAHLVNYAGFFVAPDRGLFIWTPVLIVVAPAVIRVWRDLPEWSRWLAVGGMTYTVVQLQMNVFHGGDSFYGYRIPLELLTCLVPVVGFSLHRMGPVGRAIAPAIVAMQGGVFFFGAASRSLTLPQRYVWRDNSFLVAVREFPATMAVFLGICAAVATVSGLVLMRKSHPPASDREPTEVQIGS